MAKNRRLTISGGGPLITHIRVDSNAKVRIPHKDRVQTLASLILPPKGGGGRRNVNKFTNNHIGG